MSERKRAQTLPKRNVHIPLFGLMMVLVLVAFGVYWFRPSTINHSDQQTLSGPSTVQIIMNALPELSTGNRYALWLTITPPNGADQVEYVFAGEFGADVGSTNVEFQLTEDMQDRARGAILTIQTVDVPMNSMSPVIVARGDFQRGVAALEFDGFDVSGVSGEYLLESEAGISFGTMANEQVVPLLVLPEMSLPWAYRAKLYRDETLIAMGPFFHPDQAVYALGPEVSDSDLVAGNLRISISLDVLGQGTDNVIASFDLLQSDIPQDVQTETIYSLENVARANLPSGLVVIR